jgi:hypothetical protein
MGGFHVSQKKKKKEEFNSPFRMRDKRIEWKGVGERE